MKTEPLKTLWMFKLGVKVTDSVTGFSGTITARVEYLNGCRQYGVAPRISNDGKKPDSEYFDEERLFLGAAVTRKEDDQMVAPPGGVMSDRPKF